MAEVGRPSQYTEEVKLKIKELYLESKTLEEIANIIEIPLKTLERWNTTDYEGFRQFMFALKLERMFNKSVKKLEEIVDIIAITDEGKNDKEMLKLQQDTSKFITETLGKDKGFSKRNEITGKDGQQLLVLPSEVINKNYGSTSSTENNSNGQPQI